ncbi:MAG: META domain-containing protein [Pseudodesulfovibrio sp.]|uniref:DUF306 domain-containing protein n=1 Tax=Pseudodesulfovibrio aespoeensis (strain ATCC 700646 / DSM 10631 / Aspo-2) TaxID=643562 RepID=E6VWQ9_PSEA9|nr:MULTISPECIES: META domain-containing protein [Pseudodesulfovibrio]MBU4192993.1 META domain-containing protein [Pseudomonadota bacterium]ADU63671.1 protein of unknown function DUF306 Meta and HslJ [Pseudodesulfovibrio aespoeensis Aspo-2]MBU4244954.1 META domain-containing protein [Pseudomonadota bacterium]MBU4378056.1 META domain-containing protein [Pseudomonadota bacterium]MBU4475557.1 META domain-containing protein [Pseudomonadota bacterium]
MPMKERFAAPLAVLSLVLVLVLGVGCGSKEVAPANPEAARDQVVGKTWVLHSLAGRNVVGDEQLTLELRPDGTVAGHAGCAVFSGTYTLEGATLHLSSLAAVEEKICGPSQDEQQYTYLSFLGRVASLKLDGDALDLIMEESARPLEFSTSAPGLFW